jgi:probable F420-dependent oxidoreductase
VEDLGFDYLTVSDHVVGADISNRPNWSLPYTIDSLFREPLMVLSFMAACTQRIILGTSVVIMPQRQTALVAKQLAELDLLSGGRAMLGVGVGRVELEYQVLNENFHNRGRRLEEQIAVLRALWTERSVTFQGEWHHIEAAGLNIMPIQRPIPIWMGASAETAIRRIARLGDGWFPSTSTSSNFPAQLAQFQQWARDAGRDPASIAVAPRMSLNPTEADEWPASVAGWEASGATHLGLLTGREQQSVDDHIALLRRFSEAVSLAPAR